MKKLILAASVAFATSGALAQGWEADISVYHAATVSNAISNQETVKARLGYNDFYVWSSYAKFDQIGKTQSMGHFKNLSGGLGFEKQILPSVELYGEVGATYMQPNYSTRVVNEVVYYTFYDIFGEPPFQEGWWDTLEQKYEVDRVSPAINIGARVEVYKNFSVEVEYNYSQTGAYFATWNPTWNGGPNSENFDACGCYWEGTQDIKFNAWSFGINYEW